MRAWPESIGRGLGFAAVACTLALSLPGVDAVRANDAAPPDASVSPAADASFEGFAEHLARKGKPAAVETAGPTCGAGAQNPVAAEMAQQQAMMAMRARMLAEARARAAERGDGASPDFVVLNGSGYNYRSPEPGIQDAPDPEAPAR